MRVGMSGFGDTGGICWRLYARQHRNKNSEGTDCRREGCYARGIDRKIQRSSQQREKSERNRGTAADGGLKIQRSYRGISRSESVPAGKTPRTHTHDRPSAGNIENDL